MRALVLADIHANLEALEAVLADAGASGGLDSVWCLGDIVGYGPEPVACIRRLRDLPCEAVSGNHDLAATGGIGVEDFNPYAAEAALWTAEQLDAESREWLLALPSVSLPAPDFTLTHGSLIDPVWDYLVSSERAAAHLAHQGTYYGFVGHSHVPLVFYERQDGRHRSSAIAHGFELPLDGARFVANPGSVGQPRDGDARAAYALVDTQAGRISFTRVAYDVGTTQARMRAAGLPTYLADRLSRGR